MSSEDSISLIIRCQEKCETDYNLDCKASWNVARLKGHIEAELPSHPKANTQRLIYAGHLLKDSAVLSDLLRSYSSDQLQVIHLVQTREFHQSQPVRQLPSSQLRRRNPPATQPQPQQQSPSQPQQQFIPSAAVPNFVGNFPFAQTAVNQDAMNTWMQTQQYYSLYMANYMTYIQQIYGPMYNLPGMAAASSFTQTGPVPVVLQPTGQPQQQQMPMPPNAGQPANEAQPQAAAEQAMNAQGGVEEEVRERDWLDWCYVASRFAFLVMILYFYSSIERFLFVMLCVLFVYAYQAGWFSRNFGRGPAPVPANNENENEPNPIPMPNIPNNQREVADVSTTPPAVQIPPAVPSAWTVFYSTCYIFITSFFASLIPQRPPPVNLN